MHISNKESMPKDCDNNCDLWNINDGVELAEPGHRVSWIVSYLRPVVLSANKVVVDSHEPDSED